MSDNMKQCDLFASQERQSDEVPPPIGVYMPIPQEDRAHHWLTKERLFSEIEFCDTVCPMREKDGTLHLIAQELESADFVPKNGTEQIIQFDEDEQLVLWEAFCPDWQVADVLAAYRFASDWMTRHPKDTVIVNEKSRRIVWRRSLDTVWVDEQDDMEVLSDRFIYDGISDSIECLNAAQLALGGF